MKQRCKTALFISIILLFTFIEAFADGGVYWQTDGIQICSYFSDWPLNVFDGEKGVIIIWRDGRSVNNNIYGQRIDIDGNFFWQVDGVPIAITPYTVDNPGGAIGDGKGGAIIAWKDNRQWWLTDVDIYTQRIDSLGNRLWGSSGAAVCVADSGQYNLNMVSDGEGGSIIVWEDGRNGYFYNKDLYAQRIDSSGTIQWQYNGVPVCTTGDHQIIPDIVEDDEGGAVIVWEDNRNVDPGIYAQRLSSGGAGLWGSNGVGISTGYWLQSGSRICSSGTGYIVVWGDKRNGNWDPYAQRIRNDGSNAWANPNGIPICTDLAYQGGKKVISDGCGGAIIMWDDRRNNSHDIYMQRIDSLGQVYWQENGIYVCTAADSFTEGIYIRAVSDGRSGAIVAWSPRNTPEDENIYAQRVDSSGVCQWDTNGLPVCTAPSLQRVTGICTDGEGGAIISWDDGRHGSYGTIYAQRVGDIAGVEEEEKDQTRDQGFLLCYPNPFTTATTITVYLPSKGHRREGIELNIYDIAGRLVRTIVPEFQSSRVQRVEWDGRDEDNQKVPTGVYFTRLASRDFIAVKKVILVR